MFCCDYFIQYGAASMFCTSTLFLDIFCSIPKLN